MKRWIVLLMTMALVASMGAAAFADDEAAGEDTSETSELNDKQLQRVDYLATYFAPRLGGTEADAATEVVEGADEATTALADEIIELRTGDEVTVGWGALYKLLLLAEYHGTEDLETVVTELQEDGGWGFGKAFKELREDEEWQESSDTPKNLGQFKKQQREANGAKKSNG